MTRIRSFRLLPLLLGAGLGLLSATVAQAAERDTVLGARGELYQLHSGSYADLFPGGRGAAPDAKVLALDVLRPDSEPQRFLVPETQGGHEETLPALVYEDESKSLFLVWVSRINALHSIFKLASFDGSRFSTPIDVTGNAFAAKAAPQITITRDSFTDTDSAGLPVVKRRSILQLVWEEQTEQGLYETFYTPIILEDGVYLGWNPVFRLNEFDRAAAAGTPVPGNLLLAPALQNGDDERTIIVGFTSARTGRLTTIQVDILPRELVRLSDQIRSTIIDTGTRLNYPGNLRELASQVKAAILSRGSAFHQEMLEAISNKVYNQILGAGSSQTLVSLSGGIRSTIIDTGFKFSDRGLRPNQRDIGATRTVEVSRGVGQTGPTAAGPSHLLQFRVSSSRIAPNVDNDAPVRLFLSSDGSEAAVAWTQADRVVYRDTKSQEDWSEARELRLSPNFNLDRALQVLEQRARNR